MRYENQTTQLVNPAPLEANEVFCVDGTKDITNGKMPPCTNNGGVKIGQVVRAGTLPAEVVEPSTQLEPVSDLQYYLSSNFLSRASISIVPVALIGAYSYNKKYSLTKIALLVSIPIVIITGLQYVFMGGGKNAYWGIFVPPSMKRDSMKQIQLKK
jgi:hypothetical protein